jgi:hypothetical protein
LLCFTFLFFRDLEHYGVDRVIAEISQKMGQNLANVFFIKQGWYFSGMFEIFAATKIQFMSQKWGFLF